MKNLLIILFVALFTLNVNAQNPIAVNDIFYTYPEISTSILRNEIIQNDTVSGVFKIVDTVIYSGSNQIAPIYFTGSTSWLGLKSLLFTAQAGFFGLDSITYVLTDEVIPSLYDTAKIYIHVMRSSSNLDLNNISARIDQEALFTNREVTPAVSEFRVPKGEVGIDPYLNTIHSANFWIASSDASGYVSAFGPRLGLSGRSSGPIMDEEYYEAYSEKWDRVWKVSQTEIDYHIANYTNAGYSPIDEIENWPAHGDISKGQAANLAPFVDADMDGIYNPMEGDYPKIKGQQAVYFIKNDRRSTYNTKGIEIHGMAYAYDCPSDSAINNTIFINYKIYNRSQFLLLDTYAGFFVDFEIGPGQEEYIACDVERGSFYVYNGDDFNESRNGAEGYGAHPPAQGVVFLKGPKKNNDGIDNPLTTNISAAIAQDGIPYAGLGVGYGDGIPDNEYLGMEHFINFNIDNDPINGEPPGIVQQWYYLQGKWGGVSGGFPMSWGGDGTGLADGVVGAVASSYLYPGDSDPLLWSTGGVSATPTSWSEMSEGNVPGDRSGSIGSTGPFTMQPGDMKELDLALVFGRDYQNTGNTAAIVVMQERIDSIRSYYLDDFQSVCGGVLASVNKVEEQENNLQVYPNPFNNQFMVNYKLDNATAQLMVFNMYGKLVSNQLISTTNTMVDLSAEANGIYFVQITDGATRITKKMVKQ